MYTPGTYSALTSTTSTLHSDISFTMSTPSARSTPTTICPSKEASLKRPRSAYKQVLAKLHAGFATLRLKAKKTKKSVTGGRLAPVTADAPVEKFGRPTRAISLPDAYYGWERFAKTSARFITGLFDCPSTLPGTGPEYPDLAQFVAYALFLCQFESAVNEYAMYLLWRMKSKHPEFKFAHGHGMYLAALGLAAKMTGRNDPSSESWSMIGQWIFSAKQLEVDQERLCELLNWKFEIDPEEMAMVMEHVRRGEQPDVEPIPLPTDFDDDDCADSIHSVDSTYSLSTCSIPSTWSICSRRGWDELARNDSAVSIAFGKVNTNPYGGLQSRASFSALSDN
ncbi:hypothetical protein RSOLAG22IIIB_06820 [Rhizoctonia solani]|uniref:Cyclin N-terminal domain-containing protein n=1 Tax=Rhizoctonia solani TaxID=456999 RepID=A0A0K6GGU1_9AGAM|nr:hypothetical protein RSOLAG22IIIB_06820 [Rhizoctonia solani]